MMSTCPVYLDECNALRANDSILLQKIDSSLNALQFANHELTEQAKADKLELKKRRKNIFKFSTVSFVVGFIISIFALS